LALGLSLLLAACAGLPLEANNVPSWPALAAAQSEADRPSSWPATWQHFTLPGKTSTEYLRTRVDGRDAMAANAASSASLMRKAVNIPASELDNIKFSWKVPDLIDQADLAVRENADSPVRIVLAFDGDRSKFSAKNAILSELAHVMTGEPMPYATLMYVWSNQRAPGSVIISSRTDRVRKIVVESGALNLNQWLDYERNIRADFEKAFGEAPGALIAVGIMTDTDNTRTTSRAWYGPVSLAGRR
jgi:Protein of unknown function (DUF3047)